MSSLLNALLEEDKAIVTDIAGTTRDIVEGNIRIGSFSLHLIDTAGIRDSNDRIEQMGIEKSKKMIEKAQLILLVMDGSQELTIEDQELLEQYFQFHDCSCQQFRGQRQRFHRLYG